jgi:hypothetical protein
MPAVGREDGGPLEDRRLSSKDGKVEATWSGETGDAAAMRAIGEGGGE